MVFTVLKHALNCARTVLFALPQAVYYFYRLLHGGFSGELTAELLPSGVPSCGKQLGESTAAAAAARCRIALSAGVAEKRLAGASVRRWRLSRHCSPSEHSPRSL